MYNVVVPTTWGIRMRRNRDLHIALIKGGSGSYLFENRSEELEKGKVAFVSHGFLHSSRTDPENPLSFLPIRFGVYRNDTGEQLDYDEEPFAFVYEPQSFIKHRQKYESLFLSHLSSNSFRKQEYESAILTQILLLTLNDLYALEDSSDDDRRIREIKEHIDANLTHHPGIEDLARKAKLSSKYFIRLFKKTTGVTPNQYIIRRLIERSLYLIQETDMKVCDIAQHLGYPDQFSFSRQFKSVVGCSPHEYALGTMSPPAPDPRIEDSAARERMAGGWRQDSGFSTS